MKNPLYKEVTSYIFRILFFLCFLHTVEVTGSNPVSLTIPYCTTNGIPSLTPNFILIAYFAIFFVILLCYTGDASLSGIIVRDHSRHRKEPYDFAAKSYI